MRLVMIATLALAAIGLGCGSAQSSPSSSGHPPTTSLTITVWPAGKAGTPSVRRWTLRCTPAAGTLPRPGLACVQLFENLSALRPVPKDVACTQIYGGPQVAEIRGTVRGQAVRATFRRTDGCEIARWNRLRRLFPVALNEIE